MVTYSTGFGSRTSSRFVAMTLGGSLFAAADAAGLGFQTVCILILMAFIRV